MTPPVRVSAEDTRILLLRKPPLRGPDVEALQRALVSAGYAVKVDGVFGKGTDTAVRQFQEKRGLKADGIIGPVTRMALDI
jgi:chitosanase